MKETFKQYLLDHSSTGVWTGKHEAGNPVVLYKGEVVSALPFLKELGVKLAKTTKYTERETNADMGESQSSGDIGNTGDGISKVQE